ncbi:MAG: tRNA (adenosine(37)-N6)-threonylcarbamoyltransferase complex dimerization subunit type 1 TsaB [Candidatus Marinimicrobia bacterium]|nr:tRNA (adenosine(37)-N6)-threonylcarbamoyltransferase complex dimerization subunit type 1 TsaB [Candidatus Neomarinimicrobiota bacterium]MDD5582194.1 tRNA (adenosine(37)-N6)-threonylcarbamoyltransferase complex dimerization subunit type 1 TsaB [Candidatus Neomarinimicrobiota bacterium]
MLLLAVETSSYVCGVSLCTPEGEKDQQILIDTKIHAEKLAGICNDLLTRNGINVSQLDGIAVSAGPGSFTGLRIGMSFVKGLAYSDKIPIAAVNTLFAFRYATQHIPENNDNPVWVIHSHRDYIYTLGKNEEKIYYLKVSEVKKKYPECQQVLTNGGLSELSSMKESIYNILPAWIGDYALHGESSSFTTTYDQVKINYGSRYDPVRWQTHG